MSREKNPKIFNPKHTKEKRRYLRNNMTEPEIRLWSKLKGRQMLGYKIRRQYGIGSYIVDFYCPKLKLAIEVDGESHYTQEGRKHDQKRDAFISDQGVRIIRITNAEILDNLDGVMKYIVRLFKERENHW